MSKFQIQHTCGHIQAHDLRGKYKARDWQAARLAEEDCEDCRKRRFDSECAARNAAAATANAERVKLAGSEKQVAWAESIREPVLRSLDRVAILIQDLAPATASATAREELTAAARRMIDEIALERSAAKWIGNRTGWDLYLDSAMVARSFYKRLRKNNMLPLLLAEEESVATNKN